MNYEEMMKTGRITAMRKFFAQHGHNATDSYLEWFYENFLGICMPTTNLSPTRLMLSLHYKYMH